MDLLETPLFSYHRSGGTYLTHVLLELGVCTYIQQFSKVWHPPAGGVYRLQESFRPCLGYLYPRLMEQDLYRFPSGRSVRFTHGRPLRDECEHGPLHLVRDPRGIMLSIFDRYGDGRSLTEFLSSNAHRDGPSMFPMNIMDLYPAEVWAAFSSMLEAAMAEGSGERKFLSLRFEALKANPVDEVRRVLHHLQLNASDAEILEAHERSSRKAVDEASARWHALYPDEKGHLGPKLMRSKTGGWSEQYGTEETRALGAITRSVMEEFGYSIEGQAAPQPTPIAPASLQEVVDRALEELRTSPGLKARFRLGLTIKACQAVRSTFPEHLERPGTQRALARLLELYSIAEGRPLHWLAASDGLLSAGDTAGALLTLEVGAAQAQSMGELLDVAYRYVGLGQRGIAQSFVERAAQTFGLEQIAAFDARSARRKAIINQVGQPSLLNLVGLELPPAVPAAKADNGPVAATAST